VRLKDVIASKKEVVGWGEWGTGKMPRSAFPLSQSKGNFYRLGKYEWRLVQFEALGFPFRILVMLHEPFEQYKAFLGLDVLTDTKFIASYEFHGTHPGWHVVASCEEIERLPDGIRRGPWQIRLPAANKRHRRVVFGVNQVNALSIACKFYGVEGAPPMPGAPKGQGEFGL
jgi:hypothetical protein